MQVETGLTLLLDAQEAACADVSGAPGCCWPRYYARHQVLHGLLASAFSAVKQGCPRRSRAAGHAVMGCHKSVTPDFCALLLPVPLQAVMTAGCHLLGHLPQGQHHEGKLPGRRAVKLAWMRIWQGRHGWRGASRSCCGGQSHAWQGPRQSPPRGSRKAQVLLAPPAAVVWGRLVCLVPEPYAGAQAAAAAAMNLEVFPLET